MAKYQLVFLVLLIQAALVVEGTSTSTLVGCITQSK